MRRRRKFLQRCSKRSSLSSQSNRSKSLLNKQRRRRIRRQRHRRKTFASSNSTITQIATSAFDLLHISNEPNTKGVFQFIQRHELTRQQALAMPEDQRPIVSIERNPSSSHIGNEASHSRDKDGYSSYA